MLDFCRTFVGIAKAVIGQYVRGWGLMDRSIAMEDDSRIRQRIHVFSCMQYHHCIECAMRTILNTHQATYIISCIRIAYCDICRNDLRRLVYISSFLRITHYTQCINYTKDTA